MGFKSEEICFKQVWMGERKGKEREWGARVWLVFMHSVYDATYLHRPTCSILQSIDPVYFGYMDLARGGGWCSNKEKPSGLVLAKHSLCRPFTFMYVSTY